MNIQLLLYTRIIDLLYLLLHIAYNFINYFE
jgi:hypothetical protein